MSACSGEALHYGNSMPIDEADRGALPRETDVLIVGAGPTGLTLACRLAQRGIRFVLVDAALAGGESSRAAVVHARTLEVLEAIEVSELLIGAGVVVPNFTVRDRDARLLALDFSQLPSRYPYTLMVPQNTTDALLAERLASHGAHIHRGLRAASLAQGEEQVTVELEDASGERFAIRARYAVGCDGMHSAIREAAGIGFAGSAYEESFVLADVHMKWPLPRDEVQLFFSAEGLMVVAPLPEDRHRIVATLDPAPEHPTQADIQQLLDRRGPRTSPAVVRDVVWSSRFRVHHRLAEHYRAGRVFLAGDAAHVHSPAGGQGMNTGIQDAMNLADALVSVLSGVADSAALDRYEAVRRPIAESVVRLTHRLTQVATLHGGAAMALRNGALRLAGRIPQFRRKLAMDLSELSTAR